MRCLALLGTAAPLLAHAGITLGTNGTMYASPIQNRGVHALHALNTDGIAKWIFHANASIATWAEGPDGTIFVGTGGLYDSDESLCDNILHGLDSETGDVKWSHTLSAPRGDISSFTTQDGTVLIDSGFQAFEADNPRVLEAFDAHGSVLWSLPITRNLQLVDGKNVAPDGSLLVHGYDLDGVVEGCGKQSLCVIQADGSLKWSFQTIDVATNRRASWAEDGSVILRLLGRHQHSLLRLSGEDGGIIWNVSMPEPHPAKHGDIIQGINGELDVCGLRGEKQGTCIDRVLGLNDGMVRRDLPCLEFQAHSVKHNHHGAAEDMFIGIRTKHLENASVVAYNDQFDMLWNVTLDAAGKELNPNAVHFGPDGTIVVEGAGTLSRHVFAIRDGKKVWSRPIDFVNNPRRDILIGEDGTIYMMMRKESEGDAQEGTPYLTVVDRDGAEKWRYSFEVEPIMI